MKVDPNNIQSIANAQSDAVQNAKTSRSDQSKAEGPATDAAGGSDTVQVSSKFAEVQQLTTKLQQVPDVRADRVSALKAKIQQGTYKPDASDVAESILQDPLNQSGQS